MAELDVAAGKNRHKGSLRRCKKLSTKVDLTPMVDLGFLLITFFFVATNLSKPKAMHFNLPADGNSTKLGNDAALTVLAGKNNNLYYYHGALDVSLQQGLFGKTNYSESNGIGEIIREKQIAMDKNYKGGRKEMMLLIKPTADASYENVVQLLDETLINKVGKYAIVDISDAEKKLMKE
ncbi:MAG: biopolymer transporter ExbD [Bacteroidetes bacterium]|nr:biopolymer transporter ExbD [Bacteroidota bacterium]